MKKIILKVATLFILVLMTNDLYGQIKDEKIKEGFAVQLAGGVPTNFKGKYLSGGIYYLRHRLKYTLQFNYTTFDYVKLKSFKGYLNYTKSGSILLGYNQSFRKWDFFVNTGFNFGKGRFNYDFGSWDEVYKEYDETGFFGIIVNVGTQYQVYDRLCLSVLFSALNFEYYSTDNPIYVFGNDRNYFGVQLGLTYKIKQWEKKL